MTSRSIWPQQTVLVTGAAGFLGTWLCRALAEAGATVIGLDLNWDAQWRATEDWDSSVPPVTGDIRDNELVRRLVAEHKAEVVIHLAAQTLVGPAFLDPQETFDHNIRGTWVVLEECRQSPHTAAVVVASSDKAYGEGAGLVYREDMPLMAQHVYAASKACADILSQSYGASYKLPVAITRCGNLYGGGDFNWSRIVPGTIRSILEGQPPVIRSDGNPVRDYLYVEDAAEGIMRLAEWTLGSGKPGEVFNFAGGNQMRVIDLVNLIIESMQSDLSPVILNESENEISEQRVGIEKARAVLGWQPGTSISEGLRRTVDWYAGHLKSVGAV